MKIKLMPSDELWLGMKARGIKGFVREYKFHPKRKWRIDFFNLDINLALEVEGGVWTNGRHVRGSGFINDCHKYNELVLMGFRLLRFTACMIRSGIAYEFIQRAIK